MKKIFIVVLFFIFVFPLFARDVTIIVKDIDLDIPLEGAVIRSWDGSEFICDREGKAVIHAPERQFLLLAFYPGYETGRLVIPVIGDLFTLNLRLSGVMQGRELVIEAARPGSSESRSGRSVALGAREIAQSGEMGLIEDVMNAIKLLPGVNYSGFSNSQPSIRGGHPGEMSASLDGFYINNPYHWGGGYSIFDPRMVQSAQLSHGVFSSRYGHTISGLLEVSSKKPSPTETQFELGVSSSTANFSFSQPLSSKGGLLFMGRATYYEPIFYLARQLSSVYPELDVINSIRTAPYIRSGAISGNYRFADKLELSATGFFGMDGIGVNFYNYSRTKALESDTTLDFDFVNYQGFLTTSLAWNPRADMLVKFSVGAGFEQMIIDGEIINNIYNKEFSDDFMNKYNHVILLHQDTKYQFNTAMLIKQEDFLSNFQGRIDYDWELNDSLLFSVGVQEMYNKFNSTGDQRAINEIRFTNLDPQEQLLIQSIMGLPHDTPVWNVTRVSVPIIYSPDSGNDLFTTSGYIITEYNYSFFKAELGLRFDHFYLSGKGFTLSSDPVLNPRVNLDFNILKNAGLVQSLDVTLGTGLFSSVSDNVFLAEERFGTSTMKPNRSWTSILGIKFEFPQSLSFNIEGYYKYIFDRMYIPINIGLDDIDINPRFDGEGIVWGIDAMLQKIQGRYFDGWITYSYNWAKYRDPGGNSGGMGFSGGNWGNDWYFPGFHRFHNLNLILNIKPAQFLNIYLRFGLASGIPLSRRLGDGPESYPVLIYDRDNPQESYFIEKYYWPSVTDESNRTTPSLPMDIKFSIFGNNPSGKTRYEVYVAVENVLSLVYQAQANTSFNTYTGQVDTGSSSANYDIPIPVPSFGFKISY